MPQARIAGVGLTEFGEHPSRTGRDLFAEAATHAIDDANVDRRRIDHLYFANFMGADTERQGHQAPLMAEAAGLNCSATRVESACASGGLAVRHAVQAIRRGRTDVALVGGMERMNNVSTASATESLSKAADAFWEVRQGMTFPGAYALMARAYFDEHGGTREDLAEIAVKNHSNALNNEYAHYQQEITVDDVLDAPMIADPLGLYDSSAITDGAACLILVSDDYVNHPNTPDIHAPIAITGTGHSVDQIALHSRDTLWKTPAAVSASAQAYNDANTPPGDIDIAEVHDCFTIAEAIALESLGLYDHGEGIHAATNDETTKHGTLPVNLSGGLKAKGHPVAASGVSQLCELTRLLTDRHPNSEYVPDDASALAHNAGGTVASCLVHILEHVDQ